MANSKDEAPKPAGNGRNTDQPPRVGRTAAEAVNDTSLRVDNRIAELEKEWDVERSVELNAAILAIAGTALGVLVNKRWFALPVLAAAVLAQNSIQGWNPLIPLFKRFGFRDKKEINREKYALKALRGDFKRIGTDSDKAYRAVDR